MFEIYAKKKENHPKTVKELSIINDPPGNIEGKNVSGGTSQHNVEPSLAGSNSHAFGEGS